MSFNKLLDKSKNLSNVDQGFSAKMNVCKLEVYSMDSELFPNAKNKLCHLRQAADVLVMEKSNFVTESTRRNVCGDLSLTQIRQLLLNFRDDSTDSKTVPSSVLRSIVVPSKEPLQLNQDEFFLPNISIVDSIHSSLSLWQNVSAPEELSSRKEFCFLLKKTRI